MGVNNECRQQIELLGKMLFPDEHRNMDATDIGMETLDLVTRLKARAKELEDNRRLVALAVGLPSDADWSAIHYRMKGKDKQR